jgi:hypothetical protein
MVILVSILTVSGSAEGKTDVFVGILPSKYVVQRIGKKFGLLESTKLNYGFDANASDLPGIDRKCDIPRRWVVQELYKPLIGIEKNFGFMVLYSQSVRQCKL